MSIDINIPGYTLIREIGAGGMAKVYLGMQTLLEREVAIKVMHQKLSVESEEFKQRFFTEGKVLAKLQHENIVSIIDIGEADNMLYMAMEYVEGGTLTDVLKERELTVDEAIEICSKTGLALHATHLQHIVHRDLKPSNILLRDIHTPLLTDFGIARQTDEDVGLTQTGHILGTLQYMSPEQIRGMHVDHRSDIYALGLMFYRVLVGRLPFVANSQYDLSRMQCEDIPPPLPPQLADLQPIMDAMLAKDPDDRFQTCLEFCKAIKNLSFTDEGYAEELEGATRIYDSSKIAAASYSSGRHTGPHTDRNSDRYSDRFSGQHSARHSGQFSGRTDRLPSGEYEQTRMMDDGRGRAGSGKLKKMLMFGLPLLALVITVSLYFAIWYVPSSGLSEANQRRVENYLRRVDANLLKLQIDKPPEDNAIYELRKALALAPGYPPALDRAREIAQFYETDALDLMEANKPEAALEEIRKGLEIDPEYVELVILEEEIDTMIADQKRQAAIVEAVRLAVDFQARGILIAPEGANAYTAFQHVLELDPQNSTAREGLESIMTKLLDDVQLGLDNGDLAGANSQMQIAASLFPNSVRVNEVKTLITTAERQAQDQAEVAEFLRVAQQQMNEGKYIEPDLDNALDSYTEVLNRLPDNEAAMRGLTRIAEHFTTQAKDALQREEFAEALKLADKGLLAVPDNADLLAIQVQSTGQLGARDQEIQSKLQEAQRLVLSGNYLPPGDNALDMFKSVNELDPGNEQAARALVRLPDQVFEEANQQQRLGNLRGARDLLKIAQTSFPDQSRFAEMESQIDVAITEEQKAERLQDMLAATATLIAARPVTLDMIDQSAKALGDLNKEFPGNLTAAGQLTDLVSAINSSALQVGADGNEDAGFVLLDRALSQFEGNQQLLATRTNLENTKEERLAEEARLLALTMGQLAIDAVPWGQVKDIKNSNGQSVQGLSSSRSTPFLVTLPAGSYTVSITDSDGGSPQTLSIDVVAQQVVATVAKFESLTADEYFNRSGW